MDIHRINGVNGVLPKATWIDNDAFEYRFVVGAENTSGFDLDDALVEVKIPDGAEISTATTRVIGLTGNGATDSLLYRYWTQKSPNNFYFVPVNVSGSMLVIKALGKWKAGDRRYWGVYWNANNRLPEFPYNHLEIVAPIYAVSITLGFVGDAYSITLNGTTYSYTQSSTDTAQTIASSLVAKINTGTLANASNDRTNVISIRADDPVQGLTIVLTGSTTPSNISVTFPTFYQVSRLGPNTDNGIYGSFVKMPYGPLNPLGFVGMWQGDYSYQFDFASYYEGGNRRGFSAASLDSVEVEPCFVNTSGTLRDPLGYFTGHYASTWKTHYLTTPYSDGSGSISMLSANTFKLTLATTVNTGFTSTNQNLFIFRLWDSNASGQTTVTNGDYPMFYQLPNGAFTQVNATTGVGILPIQNGMIVGTSMGNVSIHAYTMRIDSASYRGFGSATNKGLVVVSDNYGFAIGFSDVINNSIPAGATVSLNLTLMLHQKGTSAGPDTLISQEAIRMIHSADEVQGFTGPIEVFRSSDLEDEIERLGLLLRSGVQWYQNNAASLTKTPSWNTAFAYNLVGNFVQNSEDGDSSYGQGHVLHGLALQWRRTKDLSLIPLIETAVSYFISLNSLAETKFTVANFPAAGVPAIGIMPYSCHVTAGTSEVAIGTQWQRSVTYQIGDPDESASLEQMQMSSHGLWAYITFCSDTTQFKLYPQVISLWARMQAFEESTFNGYWKSAGYWGDDGWAVGNALYMGTNGTHGTTTNNGATATYSNTMDKSGWGDPPIYSAWIDKNGTGVNTSDSNSAVISFFRVLFAPDSTNQGMLNTLYEQAKEILTSDLNLHPVVVDSSLTQSDGSFVDEYPVGWRAKEGTMYYEYNATRNPSHYTLISDAGVKDSLYGKIGHYALIFGATALYNSTYEVPIDPTNNQTINIYDAFIRTLHTALTNLLDPLTASVRRGFARYLGAGGGETPDVLVDNCMLGYLLMAYEFYFLIKERNNGSLSPSSVYRFPGIYS